MRHLTIVAMALAAAGCTLDLDRLRRGVDGGLREDASIDGSIDGGDLDSGTDAGPPDAGCPCTAETRWLVERPPVVADDILAVHVSDLDRDGAADVVVTTPDTASQVLYGILPTCSDPGGFGSPEPVDELPSGRVPALADRDADGDTDAAVSDGASGVRLFTAETGFDRWTLLPDPSTIAMSIQSTRAIVTRLDFLGDPDVLVFGGGPRVEWLSMPGASVGEVATLGSEPVAAAVTSESGGAAVITLAFVTAAGAVEMVRTASSGAFLVDPALTLPGGARPTDVAFVNIDEDPEDELLVADAGGSAVLVFESEGSGTYGARTAFGVGDPPSAITAGDLDGDEIVELIVASRERSTIRIFDSRTRSQEELVEGVVGPLDVVVTDLEGDGRADLVAGGGSGSVGAQLTVLRAACVP